MQAQDILKADLLDLVFEQRNKAYGAYELRRQYPQRMKQALGAALLLCIIAWGGSLLARPATAAEALFTNGEVILDPYKQEHVPTPPVEPPPPQQQQVATAAFTPPLVVNDASVAEDDMPPPADELGDKVIGLTDAAGNPDEGIVAPPVESVGVGQVVAPKAAQEDDPKVYYKVENPAAFPGGPDAWRRFLERTLRYPEDAVDQEQQGTVKLMFTISKEGDISDIEVIQDPGYGLADEAIRIIRQSPKWTPAEQNGHKVNYRHVQAITFRLD